MRGAKEGQKGQGESWMSGERDDGLWESGIFCLPDFSRGVAECAERSQNFTQANYFSLWKIVKKLGELIKWL